MADQYPPAEKYDASNWKSISIFRDKNNRLVTDIFAYDGDGKQLAHIRGSEPTVHNSVKAPEAKPGEVKSLYPKPTSKPYFEWIAKICALRGIPVLDGKSMVEDLSWFWCYEEGMTPQEALDTFNNRLCEKCGEHHLKEIECKKKIEPSEKNT